MTISGHKPVPHLLDLHWPTNQSALWPNLSRLTAIPSQRLSALQQGPLVGNVPALYTVQGLNYVMPLVLLPFLLRALQPQGYGTIMFAQSLLGYAALIVEFGFNFTAAREISVAWHHTVAVARIYCRTMAKLLLLLCTSIGVGLLIMLVSGFPTGHCLRPASCCSTVTWCFPVVLPRGLERLKEVALIQAVAKRLVTLTAPAIQAVSQGKSVVCLEPQ